MKPRYWHIGLYALAAALIFGIADFTYLKSTGELPGLKNIWWLVVTAPLLCGTGITLGCRGAALWKRIIAAVFCGIAVGIIYTIFSVILSRDSGIAAGNPAVICMWRMFVFAVLSTIGAVVTELELPEPGSK
jgi:Na+/proline symporter